jgi:hypothetical protein
VDRTISRSVLIVLLFLSACAPNRAEWMANASRQQANVQTADLVPPSKCESRLERKLLCYRAGRIASREMPTNRHLLYMI